MQSNPLARIERMRVCPLVLYRKRASHAALPPPRACSPTYPPAHHILTHPYHPPLTTHLNIAALVGQALELCFRREWPAVDCRYNGARHHRLARAHAGRVEEGRLGRNGPQHNEDTGETGRLDARQQVVWEPGLATAAAAAVVTVVAARVPRLWCCGVRM